MMLVLDCSHASCKTSANDALTFAGSLIARQKFEYSCWLKIAAHGHPFGLHNIELLKLSLPIVTFAVFRSIALDAATPDPLLRTLQSIFDHVF